MIKGRTIIKVLLLFTSLSGLKQCLKVLFFKLKKIKEDIYAALGKYDYPCHILFVAGLPKSGTTWVENFISHIPGYIPRRFKASEGVIENHDISDEVFKNFPKRRYTCLKTHTRFTPENKEVLDKWIDSGKVLVMWRDPRDMIISRYYHVKNEQEHRHCGLYNSSSKEEGLSHSIDIFAGEYYYWIKDWKEEMEKYPESYFLIKYEELKENPELKFKKLMDFWDIPMDEEQLKEILLAIKPSKKKLSDGLSNNISVGNMSTFRSGKTGSWKDEFSDKNIQEFKEKLGAFLIDIGYEQNLNW
jgi:hypothetical protein